MSMETEYIMKTYKEGVELAKEAVAEWLTQYRKTRGLTPEDEFYNGPWYSRWTSLGFSGKKSDKTLKALAAEGFLKYDEYWGYTVEFKHNPRFDNGAQSAALDDVGYTVLVDYLKKNTNLNYSIHTRDL